MDRFVWRCLTLLFMAASSFGAELPLGPPARFEQWEPDSFVIHTADQILVLRPGGVVWHNRQAPIEMVFGGSRSASLPGGLDTLGMRTHYLTGSDPHAWRLGVKSYSRVRYKELYPGIDAQFRLQDNNVEYDFLVSPGADPSMIELVFPDADSVRITQSGELLVESSGARLRQKAPRAYQQHGGERRPIGCQFAVAGQNTVGFALDEYDRSLPLLIDPLIYSSFLGSAFPKAVAVDAAGAAYVVGHTQSSDLPTTLDAFQPQFGGGICLALGTIAGTSRTFPCDDVFVAKMNPQGSALEYLTYIGGRDRDVGIDVALDAAGAAYILAQSQRDMPTTEGVFQPAPRGLNAWVGKLDPSGQLVWATYLGGRFEQPRGVAVGADGAVYVTGSTFSRDFPVTPSAIQTVLRGGDDAFLTKLSRDGTELVYSTYLGGSLGEIAEDVSVAADGAAYIIGSTASADFPVTPDSLQPAHPAEPGRPSAFVSKIAPDGSSLIYSTFLGGSFQEQGTSLAVDRDGNALVAGNRFSEDFPLTDGTLRLGSDGFLAKLNSDGSRLLYAADVGGGNTSLAVDGEGNAYLTGDTLHSALPPTAGAVQPCGVLPRVFVVRPAFAAKVSPDGAQLLYATFLSVHLNAVATGIAPGRDGSMYVTGQVNDREFPATPGSPFFTTENGFTAALLTRIDPTPGTRLYASLIRNGASFEPGPIVPGEWISIFNPTVGPEDPVVAELDQNAAPPTTLEDTRVLFNGIPAVLTYAHHCQINAVAPFGVEGLSETEIVVEHRGERSATVRVPVGTVMPGLFTEAAIGFGNAAALNQDLSQNRPNNPATKGSVVALFGTGAGRLDPPLADGEIAFDPLPLIAADTRVLYQDPESEQWLETEVTFAGAAYGLIAGLVQINFRVPPDFRIPEGDPLAQLQVKWEAGGVKSQVVTVWVADEK